MSTKSPKVMVGVLFGSYQPETVNSLLGLVQFDAYKHKRIPTPLDTPTGGVVACGTTNIPSGRNNVVKMFLDESDCDWLLFLDTDETWPPILIEQLLASADEKKRPIISGLIMARRERDMPISPACVILDDADPPRFVRPKTVPAVRWWEVAGVGAGCLMVHRRVYEAIREKFGKDHPHAIWFDYQRWDWIDDDGKTVHDVMGEDYVFSLRAQECGFRTIVDTTIELGHIKPYTLSVEGFHRQNAGMGWCPTFVVVPVKDRLDLTKELVEQLREQGGWDGIFVFDNGSARDTKKWLAAQPDLLVFDSPDVGIHEMWNAGIEQCLYRSGGVCNIAFLNNDLKLGHNFLQGLAQNMRQGPWVAVGPNYDKRDVEGMQRVQGISADRYDGTGGLPGFAFMVRGEWFASGYRFPETMKWWFGDNDITMMFDNHGQPYGIVGDVAVEHLGQGTAKDWNDPKWSKQLAADQQAWIERWAELGVTIEERKAS